MNSLSEQGSVSTLLVSSATVRNWKRLQTPIQDRLTHRANKKKSRKRIFPLEYIRDTTTIPWIDSVVERAVQNEWNAGAILFSIGVNLLKRQALIGKAHVEKVLNAHRYPIIDDLANEIIPSHEYDLLGAVYQSLKSEGDKSIAGSYYTPRRLAKKMLLNLDFSHGERLLDPCCGSGSFLLAAPGVAPDQLFGIDIDPIAVMVAKINLLLRFPLVSFEPQILQGDFLDKGDLFHSGVLPIGLQFHYIVTNPPWGADVKGDVRADSFSRFFMASYDYLQEKGTLHFLFPEAILNIQTHAPIREFILANTRLRSISCHDAIFSGVYTKTVNIECTKEPPGESVEIRANGEVYRVPIAGFRQSPNRVFCIAHSSHLNLTQHLLDAGMYSLNDSSWALGIVTGNNRERLFSKQLPGTEPIITGKEISPYLLKPARCFIHYNKDDLQQTARDEFYRAPEKLVYKFISKKLVFAYDDMRILTLNSANILIPAIPCMSIKSVLAFLNSEVFQYLYSRLFSDVKILKSNLMRLPFPYISEETNARLTDLVSRRINEGNAFDEEIQEVVYNAFLVTPEEKRFIRNTIYEKAL